jgi:3'(2'), 5'-bisphosphate nucleotidase
MNYTDLMVEMRRAAILAGDRIMEIYNSDDFEVRSKSDDSPVTEADEAADALISERLRAAYPDVALVTEEQAGSHDINATTFLIVDPLDGTKEFVQRRGDFTVNIALVEDGVPVRGIVYAPAKAACSTPRPPEKASRKRAIRPETVGAVSPITGSDARQRRAIRRGVEIAPRCGDR